MNPSAAMKSLPWAIGRAGIALFAGASLAQTCAGSESYPVRPIRIIVANTAGSATDIATRLVANRLTESMGQQTVVDNRAGASGVIGHEIVRMFADAPFAKRISDMGQEPQPSTPAELLAHMRNETERWSKVIKAAGLKLER